MDHGRMGQRQGRISVRRGRLRGRAGPDGPSAAVEAGRKRAAVQGTVRAAARHTPLDVAGAQVTYESGGVGRAGDAALDQPADASLTEEFRRRGRGRRGQGTEGLVGGAQRVGQAADVDGPHRVLLGGAGPNTDMKRAGVPLKERNRRGRWFGDSTTSDMDRWQRALRTPWLSPLRDVRRHRHPDRSAFPAGEAGSHPP